MKTHVRHGFTLVELLVCIAIIALLISILLPTLRKARYSVELAMCMNNQRQMTTGLLIFANDNKNYYPGAGAYQDLANRDHFRHSISSQVVYDASTMRNVNGRMSAVKMAKAIRPYWGSADGTRSEIEQCPLAIDLKQAKANDAVSSYLMLFNFTVTSGAATKPVVSKPMREVEDVWKANKTDKFGVSTLVADVTAHYGGAPVYKRTTNHHDFRDDFVEGTGTSAYAYISAYSQRYPPMTGNYASQDGSVSAETVNGNTVPSTFKNVANVLFPQSHIVND